jgi:DnaJ-class molecular chaperone
VTDVSRWTVFTEESLLDPLIKMSLSSQYALLKLTRVSATAADAHRAWRRLSLVEHPDKNPGDPAAHLRFTALTDARDAVIRDIDEQDVDEPDGDAAEEEDFSPWFWPQSQRPPEETF